MGGTARSDKDSPERLTARHGERGRHPRRNSGGGTAAGRIGQVLKMPLPAVFSPESGGGGDRKEVI